MMDMKDMKSFDPEDLDWHFLFSVVSDTEHYFADMLVFQHSVQRHKNYIKSTLSISHLIFFKDWTWMKY